MGKPHVIINDKFNKIRSTRNAAFYGKPECSDRNLNEFYVNSINEAVETAFKILGFNESRITEKSF